MIGYNGWTNKDTWAVNLWLSNNESVYYSAKESVTKKFPVAALTTLAFKTIPKEEKVNFSRVNWEEIVKAFKE